MSISCEDLGLIARTFPAINSISFTSSKLIPFAYISLSLFFIMDPFEAEIHSVVESFNKVRPTAFLSLVRLDVVRRKMQFG